MESSLKHSFMDAGVPEAVKGIMASSKERANQANSITVTKY